MNKFEMGMGGTEEEVPEKKLFQKGTGKEVLTEPPHNGFKWKEGFVLVRTEKTEVGQNGSAIIGGDAFDWVPENEVEIEEEEK